MLSTSTCHDLEAGCDMPSCISIRERVRGVAEVVTIEDVKSSSTEDEASAVP